MTSRTIDLQLRIIYADSIWKRFKGLLFYKKPITNVGLLITPCNSIHMFFMRFPIDVVFLDESNIAVKIVEQIKPWRVIPPVSDAHSALELPAGTIDKMNIRQGDTIIL